MKFRCESENRIIESTYVGYQTSPRRESEWVTPRSRFTLAPPSRHAQTRMWIPQSPRRHRPPADTRQNTLATALTSLGNSYPSPNHYSGHNRSGQHQVWCQVADHANKHRA